MVDWGAASDTKLEDQPPVCYQGQFDNPICPECAPFASTHTPTTHAQICYLISLHWFTPLNTATQHITITLPWKPADDDKCDYLSSQEAQSTHLRSIYIAGCHYQMHSKHFSCLILKFKNLQLLQAAVKINTWLLMRGNFFFPLHNSNEQRRTGAGEDLKMQIKGIGVWL